MSTNLSPAKPKNFLLAAAPLFLVLFIDSMGLGLVFPILNALVINSDTSTMLQGFSQTSRDFTFGCVIAVFMFCWFFGAAFLGDLSDQIGRKKGLLICLLGAFVSYLFSAAAVTIHSFSLLLVGRVIAGFTAGSQSIAQAAIVDISQPEHKARNIGWILFVTSLGFIFGPVIGGVLSSPNLISWFNYSTPFYFAALISLLNTILLLWLFKETFFHTAKKVNLKLHHAIWIFISAFQNEKVRELSITLLILVFGWSGFYSFISMYLLRVFEFSALKTGIFMGVMGIGFGLGTGVLVELCLKRLTIKQCVMAGTFIAALCITTIVLFSEEWVAWLMIIPVGATAALAYSCLLTLFSNQVDADSQGWVMGITGSIMAFAFGLNALIIGAVAEWSIHIPMVLTIVCFVLTAFLIKILYKEK